LEAQGNPNASKAEAYFAYRISRAVDHANQLGAGYQKNADKNLRKLIAANPSLKTQLSRDPLALVTLLLENNPEASRVYGDTIAHNAATVRATRSPEFVKLIVKGLIPFFKVLDSDWVLRDARAQQLTRPSTYANFYFLLADIEPALIGGNGTPMKK
jgi:hypothetical protein